MAMACEIILNNVWENTVKQFPVLSFFQVNLFEFISKVRLHLFNKIAYKKISLFTSKHLHPQISKSIFYTYFIDKDAFYW